MEKKPASLLLPDDDDDEQAMFLPSLGTRDVGLLLPTSLVPIDLSPGVSMRALLGPFGASPGGGLAMLSPLLNTFSPGLPSFGLPGCAAFETMPMPGAPSRPATEPVNPRPTKMRRVESDYDPDAELKGHTLRLIGLLSDLVVPADKKADLTLLCVDIIDKEDKFEGSSVLSKCDVEAAAAVVYQGAHTVSRGLTLKYCSEVSGVKMARLGLLQRDLHDRLSRSNYKPPAAIALDIPASEVDVDKAVVNLPRYCQTMADAGKAVSPIFLQAVKSTLLEWDAKNILLGKWPATKCAAALMYTHKANPQLAPHIKPKDFSDATGVTLITMQRAARSVKKS